MRAPHWDGPPLEAWAPWTPREVARRLEGAGVSWCVVGGWAIDLFVGRQTREHHDLEVAVLRQDFEAVRSHLAGYALHWVSSGEVHRLASEEAPPADSFQVWVADTETDAWRVDVMLERGDASTWVFRRDASVTAPRASMVGVSAEGIPFLLPLGVLLYKARDPREKDEADFATALPLLDAPSKAWLAEALERVYGAHRWFERLRT